MLLLHLFFPLSILKYFFNNDISKYNSHYISILFPNVIIRSELDSTQNKIDIICNMFNHVVGIKDKWTVAITDEMTKNLIENHNIKLEINYGKN